MINREASCVIQSVSEMLTRNKALLALEDEEESLKNIESRQTEYHSAAADAIRKVTLYKDEHFREAIMHFMERRVMPWHPHDHDPHFDDPLPERPVGFAHPVSKNEYVPHGLIPRVRF